MLHEGGTEGRGGPPSFLLLLYSNVVANLAPDLGPGGGGGGQTGDDGRGGGGGEAGRGIQPYAAFHLAIIPHTHARACAKVPRSKSQGAAV